MYLIPSLKKHKTNKQQQKTTTFYHSVGQFNCHYGDKHQSLISHTKKSTVPNTSKST